MSEPLLDIRSLRVAFGDRVAVADLNLQVQAGQTTVLVGESGSGKSVTALAALGLLPPEANVSGEILFASMDLLSAKESRLRSVRGGGLAMVFQEPMTSLNPVFTVGEQIEEAVGAHERLSGRSRRLRMEESLEEVGIDRRRRREYPHQFSGGMRQRVMIAMALACRPRVLIADEPTTALDVVTASEIVAVLHALQERRNMGMLFITHDLLLAERIADTIVVLRAGKVVESGSRNEVIGNPKAAYTRELLACTPRIA